MFACASEYMRKMPVLRSLLWARQFSGIGVELNSAEVNRYTMYHYLISVGLFSSRRLVDVVGCYHPGSVGIIFQALH